MIAQYGDVVAQWIECQNASVVVPASLKLGLVAKSCNTATGGQDGGPSLISLFQG